MNSFVTALKELDDKSFDYTAYGTNDPIKFIAVFNFDDDAARQRFLSSQAFVSYRDGTKDRFTSPPSTTGLKLIAGTEI